MTDPSNKYGWRPGWTNGTSEGKWSAVNHDKRMRYEKANPQHYETPDTEAYRTGWERIFGKRKIHAFACPEPGGSARVTVTRSSQGAAMIDLDAIEARANRAIEFGDMKNADYARDVPALVAEVRRLRDGLAAIADDDAFGDSDDVRTEVANLLGDPRCVTCGRRQSRCERLPQCTPKASCPTTSTNS